MEYEQLKEQHLRRGLPVGSPPDTIVSPHHTSEDSELIAEAKLLRQHKGRLEARMQILEDHNKQLESQLHRLRQLLEQVGPGNPRHDARLPAHPSRRSLGAASVALRTSTSDLLLPQKRNGIFSDTKMSVFPPDCRHSFVLKSHLRIV